MGYMKDLIWIILMFIAIWFSIDTIGSTFSGIILICITTLIAVLAGFLISRKPNASEGWGNAFEARNVFQRQRKSTYIFLIMAIISFVNVSVFVGGPEVIQTKVIEKYTLSGKTTAYKLLISPINKGQLGLRVGEKFWESVQNDELIEITTQKNILGLYVVTSYKKANKQM